MRKITKTALRRIYARTEPETQLDPFVNQEAVAQRALLQLREADRLAEEAGIKLRPLVKKRK